MREVSRSSTSTKCISSSCPRNGTARQVRPKRACKRSPARGLCDSAACVRSRKLGPIDVTRSVRAAQGEESPDRCERLLLRRRKGEPGTSALLPEKGNGVDGLSASRCCLDSRFLNLVLYGLSRRTNCFSRFRGGHAEETQGCWSPNPPHGRHLEGFLLLPSVAGGSDEEG